MEAVTRRLLSTVYSPPPAISPWVLKDLLPDLTIRHFSFGRRALAEGLRAAGIKEGDAVLLPGFICRDVLSSLSAVGARPLYYEVDERLSPAQDPARWPKASAVVAVDYFGFPQDLAPFRSYCEKNLAVLIEDNAHGLFSRDSSGRPLGTRGDLGIFSLRKTLPLPDGAALALARGRHWSFEGQPPFSAPDSLPYLLKQATRVLARAMGPVLAFQGLSLLRRLRHLRTGRRFPEPHPEAERVLPVPELPNGQLKSPLAIADPELEARRRRELYALVSSRLVGDGIRPVFDSLPEGTVPYAFPYRAGPEEDRKAARLLASWGLEPLPWPDLPGEIAAKAPAHYKDVRLVHFLW